MLPKLAHICFHAKDIRNSTVFRPQKDMLTRKAKQSTAVVRREHTCTLAWIALRAQRDTFIEKTVAFSCRGHTWILLRGH